MYLLRLFACWLLRFDVEPLADLDDDEREFDQAFANAEPVELVTPPGGVKVRIVSAAPGCEVNPPQRTWTSAGPQVEG